MSAVIRFKNVCKAYRILHRPAALPRSFGIYALKRATPPPWDRFTALQASCCCDFHALLDVLSETRRGELTAIGGRNGSGKSTQLQIIAVNSDPNAGQLEVIGRVAVLLEFGSGFDPEFTESEKVFLAPRLSD